MSTRCNVIIREGSWKILLYHHHDGYPEGVGKDLKSLMERIVANHWFIDSERMATILVKNETETTGFDDKEYEPACCLHYDIEYLYEIDVNKNLLKCYAVKYHNSTGRFGKKLVEL